MYVCMYVCMYDSYSVHKNSNSNIARRQHLVTKKAYHLDEVICLW